MASLKRQDTAASARVMPSRELHRDIVIRSIQIMAKEEHLGERPLLDWIAGKNTRGFHSRDLEIALLFRWRCALPLAD